MNRICTNSYTIPGTDKVIEKGTEVLILVVPLHTDALYYDKPEMFKPERFIEGRLAGQPYYPFGDGPHNCVAQAMGKLMTKVGIILLLPNYKYELASKTAMEFHPKHMFLSPKNPAMLRVIKR